MLIVVLVMYNTLFIVLVVCYNRFNPATGLYWYEGSTGETNALPMGVDYLVDLVFIADIGLTFRTTFFDQENELVLDKRVIARNYLKFWFPVCATPCFSDLCCIQATSPALLRRATNQIDVVATMPFELLGFAVAPHHALMPQV